MLNELDSFWPRKTLVWVKALTLDQTLKGEQVVNLVVNYKYLVSRVIIDFANIDAFWSNLFFPISWVDQLDWISQTLSIPRVWWAIKAHIFLSQLTLDLINSWLIELIVIVCYETRVSECKQSMRALLLQGFISKLISSHWISFVIVNLVRWLLLSWTNDFLFRFEQPLFLRRSLWVFIKNTKWMFWM